MRLILFLASIITVGALGVTSGVVPLPTQMLQAIAALGGDPTKIGTINMNPVDGNNNVLPQILKGTTPEDAGFHGSAVTSPSGNFRTMNNTSGHPGTIVPNSFAASIVSQFQRDSTRMQDLAAYARNPEGWHGAPPH